MTIFFRTQGRGCYLPGIVVEATELRPLESWIHLPRLVFFRYFRIYFVVANCIGEIFLAPDKNSACQKNPSVNDLRGVETLRDGGFFFLALH
jgi:hypothetical protein